MSNYIYYIKDFKKNRINLYFSDIPSFDTRNILKSHKWRYSSEELCWYTYISEETEIIAKSIGAVDGTDYSSDDSVRVVDSEVDLYKLQDSFEKWFGYKPPQPVTLDHIKLLLAVHKATAPEELLLNDVSEETIGVILNGVDGQMYPVIFTDSTEEVDNKQNYLLMSTFARTVINNIIEEKYYVIINSEVYRIGCIAYSENNSSIKLSRRIRNEYNPVKIQIYKLKMPCSEHRKSVECVTAYVQVANGKMIKPISIYYCSKCNKYYINSDQYKEFVKNNGLPYMTLETEHNESMKLDFNSWNDESILHYMGYNVGAGDDLSASERQGILRHAIDTNSLTKAEVVSFLEFLIYHNRNSYKFENACDKWNEDLQYIRSYRKNRQKTVIGEFQ